MERHPECSFPLRMVLMTMDIIKYSLVERPEHNKTRLEYLAAHPEILSGKVTPDEISGDLNKFAAKIGAEFINDTVVNIDFKAKKVKTGNEGREIPYDFLVISIGAEQTFFGIPGAEELSHSVNTLKGAVETKNALDKLDFSAKEISIAVIGAGLTGVEGMKDVFAVGDTISFESEGVRSGQNAEEAERQGEVAAENIIKTIKNLSFKKKALPKKYYSLYGMKEEKLLKRYIPKNTIQNPRAFISLGSNKAVMYFRGMVIKVLAYRLKKSVERRYMKRFKKRQENKLLTQINAD